MVIFLIGITLILKDTFSMHNFNLKSKGFDLQFKSNIDMPDYACNDCEPVFALEFLKTMQPLNISIYN